MLHVLEVVLVTVCLLLGGNRVSASIAYGSLNNFDCVNDTGVEAHGFDIELDDIHSKDITYTYDYNHYGVPKITEDNSDPLHPKVLVRYASAKNPDGSWAAYTAIPAGPIAPTQGHQFTDPSVNFGGEHFGVGYYGAPSAVRYFWLIDNGTGTLVHGAPVNVATPTFTYMPPAGAAPANVVAVIAPPPPPVLPAKQFGEASWVKEIKTTTHNPNKVRLVDLVGGDPGEGQPWANGEPAEVEVEWRLLQTEFGAANGGPNGELQGAPEDLPGGDEVITRRYEFYKYTGPIDAESGEAMADAVAPDGIHGTGSVTYITSFDPNTGEPITSTVDLSTLEIVGEFFGAQMSGFDAAPNLGLIDNLQDGEVNVAYAERRVVVAGPAAFQAIIKAGSLPDGMAFEGLTGILSGTPTVGGVFKFTVEASDTTGALLSKEYTLNISQGAAAIAYSVTTSSSPAAGGTTTGQGSYDSGTSVTVIATANAGYSFVNWTEGGVAVSALANYQFTISGDRNLVANFSPISYTVSASASPSAGGVALGSGSYNSGTTVTVIATPNPGYTFVNWTEGGVSVSDSVGYQFTISGNHTLVANFAPITYTVTTSSAPNGGGSTSGAGAYNAGASVTVTANPNPGYIFLNWTEGGVVVSASASYQFNAIGNRDLVANFAAITYSIVTTSVPSNGGMTSGGGIYNAGQNVTVVATANPGYVFVNWTEAGAEVSAAASYAFSADANRVLVANFAPITYNVTTSSAPSGGGTTTGAGAYADGANVVVTATANSGYTFINWTEGGVEVSASASYSFTAGGNRALVANFRPTVTLTVWPGSVLRPSGRYVPVLLRVRSADPLLKAKIIGVTMNEVPEKRKKDWFIIGDLMLLLRADCENEDVGRIYTITVQYTDGGGNTSTATTTVTIRKRNHRED